MDSENSDNSVQLLVVPEPKTSPQSLEDVSAELKQLAAKQAKVLENARAQQEKSSAMRERAAQIKAILQHKLDNGGHSDEVNQHIKNAIGSCDACINSGENDHVAVADHLHAAHAHVHQANEKHKGTSCNNHNGHHAEKPKFIDVIRDSPDELEHSH
jgi:ElaB/YqjD/DUF883 family membrane-anchored ribosome-binding protein